MKKKLILWLLLGGFLLLSPGCMATGATLNKANVQDHIDKDGKFTEQTVEKPGWLVLVPLAVVFDVATSPIQCVVLLCTFRDCH